MPLYKKRFKKPWEGYPMAPIIVFNLKREENRLLIKKMWEFCQRFQNKSLAERRFDSCMNNLSINNIIAFAFLVIMTVFLIYNLNYIILTIQF